MGLTSKNSRFWKFTVDFGLFLYLILIVYLGLLGDIKKLRESYPDYFMDTQALIRHLSEIMTDKFI